MVWEVAPRWDCNFYFGLLGFIFVYLISLSGFSSSSVLVLQFFTSFHCFDNNRGMQANFFVFYYQPFVAKLVAQSTNLIAYCSRRILKDYHGKQNFSKLINCSCVRKKICCTMQRHQWDRSGPRVSNLMVSRLSRQRHGGRAECLLVNRQGVRGQRTQCGRCGVVAKTR